MRDALSLLDQAIAHGAGSVEESQVRAMLGTVDIDYQYSILEAVQAGDVSELLRVAADMSLRSLSFGAALQELAGLLTRLQIVQCAPASLDDEDSDRTRLLELASRLSPEFVQLAYQIVIHGRPDLPMAPVEYGGFMMTLLRMHGFRPDSVADVVSSIKSVSRAAPTRIVAEAVASSPIFPRRSSQRLLLVQCSAAGMAPEHLKVTYGGRIVFWGGGVDTQRVLPFGTPGQVREQVLRRCYVFAKGGGYVFNPVHNIQAQTPVENVAAMVEALREFRGEH